MQSSLARVVLQTVVVGLMQAAQPVVALAPPLTVTTRPLNEAVVDASGEVFDRMNHPLSDTGKDAKPSGAKPTPTHSDSHHQPTDSRLLTPESGAHPHSNVEPMQLHMLDPSTSRARCLDGSAYGYYFRRATDPSAANKYVIEMQGGGWCYDPGDCYGRTLPGYAGGAFGSSKNWTSTMGGYFADNQGWNRVFLRYCSGASFTGSRVPSLDASGWPIPGHPPGVVVPSGTQLWFRGAFNVDDTVAALRANHDLNVVDELVVTGSSAGGLATILNVDRIASLVGARRVAGLSDAGFFKCVCSTPFLFLYHGSEHF
jgi:hypothetical protein